MRRSITLSFLAASLFVANAQAHPGAEILTAGGAKTRTAMSGGVSFEEVNGVHLFKGGVAMRRDQELLGDEPVREQTKSTYKKEVEIILLQQPFRHIRHLRTQGFYSGRAYPSRQYRQGFYSTGR